MLNRIAATAMVAAVAVAPAVHAQTLAALIGGDTLATIDVPQGKVTRAVKISGAPAPLVGIDVRPSDGMLYGLATDGTVLTIEPGTGQATMKSKLEMMVPAGTTATMDFNPVADRLRVLGADGTNLRANVDDGKVTRDGQLKFAENDMHKGMAPLVTAGAYTNSMKGAKETALYDVDTKLGGLFKQAPPNDGVLAIVGKLGVDVKTAAFDIAADGAGTNTGWLLSGTTLYRVDLASGKATEAGKVKDLSGTVQKITVLPPA